MLLQELHFTDTSLNISTGLRTMSGKKASPLKTFYMSLNSTKNLKEIQTTIESLNQEGEITDVLFINLC